ncbi:hypothetical protein B0H11DRAFT_1288186 [Mycena galericulata]|nr:hypothetical protein B0H11DRAFT_1288186 [Mycena galericulata]
MMPMGVRLLLKDWDIGTDPRDFVYRDPYDGAPEEPAPARVRRPTPPKKEHFEIQRPPLVVASTSINHFDTSRRRFVSQDIPAPPMSGSQPTGMSSVLPGVSQDLMASTQILPGAYGGRPVMKKKKRLGGF